MVAAVKLKVKRGKKRWFTVQAPDIFKNVDAGEITAYEPKELVGRKVFVVQSMVTSNPKDSQKNLDFRITDVKGETAVTVPWRYYLQDSFVSRTGRKYKTNVVCVVYPKSKDGMNLKVKLDILAERDIHNSVRASLIHKLEEAALRIFGSYNGYDLFAPGLFDKLADELKKELVKIYPIDRIMVEKVRI